MKWKVSLMNFDPWYRPRNIIIVGLILNPITVALIMIRPDLNIPVILYLSNFFIVVGIFFWLVNKYDGTDYDIDDEEDMT